MDIKKICRLCFKSDIQNEFIDMQAVPGLCEEAALVYGLEISEDDGISRLICSDCRNKTITLSAHVEMVQKTQIKIAELQGQAAPNLVSQSIDEALFDQENQKCAAQNSKTGLYNTLKSKGVQNIEEISGANIHGPSNIGKRKFKNNNMSGYSSRVDKFAIGESVKYYDMQLKQSIDAVIVQRITYGQYVIKVGNRSLLRKAFFLSKK